MQIAAASERSPLFTFKLKMLCYEKDDLFRFGYLVVGDMEWET
jgi:hypothetical protein